MNSTKLARFISDIKLNNTHNYAHYIVIRISVHAYIVIIIRIFTYIGICNGIAVQLQYDAVDTYMKLCRFKEEESQIIHKMTSFLIYFKDNILPRLYLSANGGYLTMYFS